MYHVTNLTYILLHTTYYYLSQGSKERRMEREEVQVRISSFSLDIIEKFEAFLKQHYKFVISTGIKQNTRPPYENGFRAYFTLVLEGTKR